MIILFIGTDRKRVVDAFNDYVAVARAKQPTAAVLSFNGDNLELGSLEEALIGQTLFAEQHLILSRDLSTKLSGDEAARFIDWLKNTRHLVLILETGEKNALAKELLKLADEVKTFNQAATSDRAFNIFTISDALVARDRKGLWLTFHHLLKQGAGAEQIFWTLVWQLKTIILVAASQPGKDLGLKPLVMSKARAALRRFSPTEAAGLQRELLNLYHHTYPDSEDFTLGLEKIILTL